MKIEIIKGTETPATKFFSNTPETDAAWACFKGYMEPLQDVQDLSRKLERERDEARKDAAQLADRLSGLELRTTEELAKLEQERNASRELAIAFHNDQTNLILLLQEWKDMAAKLVNIASYALGEFDVQLTLDQQRTITETMREYHSLLKKQ
jgi:hypothetical protein